MLSPVLTATQGRDFDAVAGSGTLAGPVIVSRWLQMTVACALAATACTRPTAEPLVLATTTSVGNSGLLEALLPAFEKRQGLAVRSHLAGSGRSLEMLADGEVDLVISHAPAAERAALASHRAWQ